MTIVIRPARPEESGVVAAMWAEASTWLASVGSDQWQYPPRRERIEASIAAGECWLACEDGRYVATVTLDERL